MMNNSEPQPSQPSNFGKVLRAILRTILALVLVMIIIGALAVAGYYGMVYVNNQAVVPAQNARAGLVDLSTRQAHSDQSLSQLSESLNSLEASRTQEAAKIDSLTGAVSDLQTAVQQHSQTLSRLGDIETSLNNLTQQMDASTSNDDALQSTLAAENLSFQDLQIQVKLLQAMELLNRSRLYLLQSNYGLASSDVDGARQILTTLQPLLPSYQQDAAGLLIQRLKLANTNLPAYPILAGDDLEVAWGMLASGLPSAPTGTPTSTLSTAVATQATASLQNSTSPSATPTPYGTATPLAGGTPAASKTATVTGT